MHDRPWTAAAIVCGRIAAQGEDREAKWWQGRMVWRMRPVLVYWLTGWLCRFIPGPLVRLLRFTHGPMTQFPCNAWESESRCRGQGKANAGQSSGAGVWTASFPGMANLRALAGHSCMASMLRAVAKPDARCRAGGGYLQQVYSRGCQGSAEMPLAARWAVGRGPLPVACSRDDSERGRKAQGPAERAGTQSRHGAIAQWLHGSMAPWPRCLEAPKARQGRRQRGERAQRAPGGDGGRCGAKAQGPSTT